MRLVSALKCPLTGRGLPKEQLTPQRFRQEAEKIDRLAEDFKHFFSAHFGATFTHEKRLNK
jgi:hypothetical protein